MFVIDVIFTLLAVIAAPFILIGLGLARTWTAIVFTYHVSILALDRRRSAALDRSAQPAPTPLLTPDPAAPPRHRSGQ